MRQPKAGDWVKQHEWENFCEVLWCFSDHIVIKILLSGTEIPYPIRTNQSDKWIFKDEKKPLTGFARFIREKGL